MEAKEEEERLSHEICKRHRSLADARHIESFTRDSGLKRRGVIVRHNVKRRWEKLGVWNPEWGFAGRNAKPRDEVAKWVWPWQPDNAADDFKRACQDAGDLVLRVLHLRRNLRRGEHAPVIPQSCPGRDVTASQAEAFLISRPWFIYQIEVGEEKARYNCLSAEDQIRYSYSAEREVIKWWKERGDFRDMSSLMTSWKWRHESPSPEPEDITPIHDMKESAMEAATDMHFTPSEIDDFETIELPESEQPEHFWVILDGSLPSFFPGQMSDIRGRNRKAEKERQERIEKARAEGRELPEDPITKKFLEEFMPWHKSGRGMFASPPESYKPVIFTEAQAAEFERQHDIFRPPQSKRRVRQRWLEQGGRGAEGQQEEVCRPSPRRSARIAGMKRAADPLPQQAAPNKRLRSAPTGSEPTAPPAVVPTST